MDGYEEAQWSRFCGGLLSYIETFYCSFIETDYNVELNMSIGEIVRELQLSKSISDLSPQLQVVAKQYESTIK